MRYVVSVNDMRASTPEITALLLTGDAYSYLHIRSEKTELWELNNLSVTTTGQKETQRTPLLYPTSARRLKFLGHSAVDQMPRNANCDPGAKKPLVFLKSR